MAIIKHYYSYFNYYIIEHITDFLGTDKDKQMMLSYKEAFSQYVERRVYECPAEFGSLNDDDCTIIVKLDESYDDCTALQLIILKNKLCDIFNILDNGVLRLCTVEQGCYELTFQAPLFIQESIFPLSSEQETALNKLKIVWLLCGDYEFSPSTLNQVQKCLCVYYITNIIKLILQEYADNRSDDNGSDDDGHSVIVHSLLGSQSSADDISKAYKSMEHEQAVKFNIMQPTDKVSDYAPSDSGVGFDAETKSASDFTEVMLLLT